MQSLQQIEALSQPAMQRTTPLKRTAQFSEQEDTNVQKRTRGRSGCLNCRRRRKKCDEAKPDCSKCRSRGEECEWDTGITFRLSGLDPQHPSMLQARTPKSVVSKNGLRIVDVHFEDKAFSGGHSKVAKAQRILPQQGLSTTQTGDTVVFTPGQDDTLGLTDSALCQDIPEDGVLSTIPEEPSQSTGECGPSRPKCRAFPFEQANPADLTKDTEPSPVIIETTFDADEDIPNYPRSNSDGSTSMPSLPWSAEQSTSSVTSVSSRSTKHDQGKDDSGNDGMTYLESLDCLMNSRHIHVPPVTTSVTANRDDTYSTALEKTKRKFHHHVRDISHKMLSAHQTSSDTDADESAAAMRELRLSENKFNGIRLVQSPMIARPLGCTKLLKRRQLELWRNFIDNVAPSLDVCSNKRYIQHSLPTLAKGADHLHYAALALSSRQMASKQADSSLLESSGLYQDAINLLLPELHTLDTPTVTACVILSLVDLLSSSSSYSNSSIAACTSLLEAADINVRSGGIRQAVFWSFANVVVWQSLSNPEYTSPLPTRSFYPSDSLATAVNYIRSLTLGDGYAKYAVFLTSAVIEAVSSFKLLSQSKHSQAQLQARHSALTDLLADWCNCRPEDMQPLMSYPSILDDEHHPFPMVLYPTVSASIANLLYHCASILLLQNSPRVTNGSGTGKEKSQCNDATISTTECQTTSYKPMNSISKCSPPDNPSSGKGITWHARQICGILSETHDPAVLVHGRHALDVAGRVMVQSSQEKDAVLRLLERVEREGGWRRRC